MSPPSLPETQTDKPLTPVRYDKKLAQLAGAVDAAATQYQATNSSSRNGSNGSNGHLVAHPLVNMFPTTQMSRELQELVAALRTEEIEWKSLTTEQKKQLGIEVAAEILVQEGNSQKELTRELFDQTKPTWMPTMHALCLGAPISASYLRAAAATLAATRLQNRQAPSEDANPAPSQEASQAPSQDASPGSASSSEDSAPSSSD